MAYTSAMDYNSAVGYTPEQSMMYGEQSPMEGSQFMVQETGTTSTTGSQQNESDDKRLSLLLIVLCLLAVLLIAGGGYFILTTRKTTNTKGNGDGVDEDMFTPELLNYEVPAPAQTPPRKAPPTPSSAHTSPSTGNTRSSTLLSPPPTTPTTTTTTEDTLTFNADYTKSIYSDPHRYVCLFNSSTQGFKMFQRTYGIAMFPYIYCHVAVYCCYNLTNDMNIEPGRPDVDLPPRGAVKRLADYQHENAFLTQTLLLVQGSSGTFTKLAENKAGEQATFMTKSEAWMKDNNYNGVRLLWQFPDANQKGLVTDMFKFMSDYMLPKNLSAGYFIPLDTTLAAGFDTATMAIRWGRRNPASLIGYPYLPMPRPSTLDWFGYRGGVQYSEIYYTTKDTLPSNVTRATCEQFPAAMAVTFRLKDDCTLSDTSDPSDDNTIVGPGDPGPYTKEPGIMSIAEVCHTIDKTWNVTVQTSSILACKEKQAIVFLDSNKALGVMENVHDAHSLGCIGVVASEYDDYTGQCRGNTFLSSAGLDFEQGSDFPLQKGAFRYFTDIKADDL